MPHNTIYIAGFAGIFAENLRVTPFRKYLNEESKAPGTYRVAAIAREWYYGSGEASYKIRMKKSKIKTVKS